MCELRLRDDRYALCDRIEQKEEADRLVVHQERIGPDVVGPQRIAVERSGMVVRCFEKSAIEDEVSTNLAQTSRPQGSQQQPEVFEGELRIPETLE